MSKRSSLLTGAEERGGPYQTLLRADSRRMSRLLPAATIVRQFTIIAVYFGAFGSRRADAAAATGPVDCAQLVFQDLSIQCNLNAAGTVNACCNVLVKVLPQRRRASVWWRPAVDSAFGRKYCDDCGCPNQRRSMRKLGDDRGGRL